MYVFDFSKRNEGGFVLKKEKKYISLSMQNTFEL